MYTSDGHHAEHPSWRTTFKARLTEWSWQLKRLVDIMQTQGPGVMSRTATAWLLGVQYGRHPQQSEEDEVLTDKDMQLLLADFRSHVWCTYRREFAPLGADGLVSDVGWGCTLRSGQMLMAEAALRHTLGRGWRRHSCNSAYSQEQLMQVLSALLDHPEARLSIHRICAAGEAHGVVPGRWLGPWVLCKTLASLVNSTPQLGLRLHVVCDPGGGAPSLNLGQLLALMRPTDRARTKDTIRDSAFNAAAGTPSQQPTPPPGSHLSVDDSGSMSQEDTPAQAPLDDDLLVKMARMGTEAGEGAQPLEPQAVAQQSVAARQVLHAPQPLQESGPGSPPPANAGSPDMHACRAVSDDVAAAREQSWEPVLSPPVHSVAGSPSESPLIVPTWQQQEQQQQEQHPDHNVSLPPAAQQLPHGQHLLQAAGAYTTSQASNEPTVSLILLLPLTLGVGKTNPVYYPQLLRVLTFPQSIGIVGGRPSASLYFVGHQEQQLMYLDPHVPQTSGMLPSTYFCDTIRLLPITSIDPSLAIGFYCETQDDVVDLVQRLESLNHDFDKAPIVTVASDADAAKGRLLNGGHRAEQAVDAGDDQSWEML